jgi:hypothetical protein
VARRITLPPDDDDPLSIILDRPRRDTTTADLASGYIDDNDSNDTNRSKVSKVSIGVPKTIKKIRVAFHLPVRLADEARNCVYHLSGPPLRLTMAELAENAIAKELERLQIEYNEGKSFPHRRENLKGGRPVR